MPLRPARVGRVGVIGHPVAKTAVVAKAVTPGRTPSGGHSINPCMPVGLPYWRNSVSAASTMAGMVSRYFSRRSSANRAVRLS